MSRIADKAKNFVSEKIANMPKPEATINDVDLKRLGRDGITLLVKVSVSNPYPIPIPIGEIRYKVKSVDRLIASGSIPDPGSIKANGLTNLDVTVKVAHGAVVSLVRDIAADWDIDYLLELEMVADGIPIIGDIVIPVSYRGEMKLPTFSGVFKAKSESSKAG